MLICFLLHLYKWYCNMQEFMIITWISMIIMQKQVTPPILAGKGTGTYLNFRPP